MLEEIASFQSLQEKELPQHFPCRILRVDRAECVMIRDSVKWSSKTEIGNMRFSRGEKEATNYTISHTGSAR